MSGDNPLVAGPREMSTPFTGTFLLEDGEALAQAIKDGDWVAGGLATLSTAADLVATVSDPLGSLIAAGIGWIIEHLNPIKKWFNDLTGDAGEVAGFAGTWANVAAQMKEAADLYRRRLSDVEGMSGQTINAYRAYANDVANHLALAGSWAQAISVGFELCSTMVKMVHDMTRDALSQLAGMAISCAIELAVSAGTATPLVIEQITTRLLALTEKIGARIVSMFKSMRSFIGKINDLVHNIGNLRHLFDVVPGGLAMAGVGMLPKHGRMNDGFLARANKGGGGGNAKPPRPSSKHIDWDARRSWDQLEETVDIDFNTYSKNPKEFHAQLKEQEEGLNLITVQEYLDNRAHYKEHGRDDSVTKAIRKADVAARFNELRKTMSASDAMKQAKAEFADVAPLHGPDQVIGGFYDKITRWGDANVNSSIGGAWPSKVKTLDDEIKRVAEGMSDHQRRTTRLNVRLNGS